MAYTKQNWYDLPNTTTPFNATRMLNIENGIKANSEQDNYNVVTEDSTGKIKCTLTGTLSSGDIIPISVPTLTNTTTTMQLSIDGGTTYYYIKNMQADAVYNDFQNTELSGGKFVLYFDGTYFILDKSKFGGKIITNSNTITRNGFYTAFGTATGVPNSNYSWFITHQNSNANTNSAYQRAVAYSTDLIIYERVMQNGTWGAWENVNAGWLSLNRCTFTYTSFTSATYTAVMSTSIDLTSILSLGMKIRLIQSSTTKYGIITAISSNSITLFMGTDYTLANATISNVYFSDRKAPYGFPLNPDKWTITFTDTTRRSQSSPAYATWYNIEGLNTVIPVGLFKLKWKIWAFFAKAVTSANSLSTCISTSNNSASDANYITSAAGNGYNTASFGFTSTREEIFNSVGNTTIYFNCMSYDLPTTIYFNNNESALVFKAVCAYL